MKIFVTGTRGIPDIPGGVEKHCQELYPIIASLGHDVILSTRIPYVSEKKESWKGIRLLHTFTSRKKSIEAIIHTFLSVIKARFYNPDILHVHAIGPGLMVPFARLLGMKVVVTNHGPDYDRGKWGWAAKTILRLGEYLGGRYANEVIVISEVIRDIVKIRCGRESNLIYNGVPIPVKNHKTEYLDEIGVKKEEYIIAVARLVPEKGIDLLVRAFKKLNTEYKLVIAGDADHETDYSRSIKKMMSEDKRIIHTGYITGEPLNQVFSNARLFVLPSYHEGLPIALLEAMSYGLSVLISDIPANKEVELPADRFFKSGDMDDLLNKMEKILPQRISEIEKRDMILQIAEKYNWAKIAEQTIDVYLKASCMSYETVKKVVRAQ